jgi:hypothetical protein
VAGVIAVTNEDTGIDLYMGTGGAPEGVLAAAALRCVGGQFKGRLLFRNEDEKARARKGHRGSEQDLRSQGTGQGRLHLRGDRRDRRIAAEGRESPQGRRDDHRQRGDARRVGHRALGARRAPQQALIAAFIGSCTLCPSGPP